MVADAIKQYCDHGIRVKPRGNTRNPGVSTVRKAELHIEAVHETIGTPLFSVWYARFKNGR